MIKLDGECDLLKKDELLLSLFRRFGDTPSNDWVTETIVVDSDPVEDIDAENYIEEIREDPSMFHHRTFRPIIIGEETEGPTLEEALPQIQIVEY